MSIAKRAEVEILQLELAEIMRRFPLDQRAALAKAEGVRNARGEMFAIHLATMARVQQIVGKELWQRMHDRRGDGAGPWVRSRHAAGPALPLIPSPK